jgi:hypothetical protein
MRIDSEARQTSDCLPNCSFNGRTRLARRRQQWLIIDDTPSVQDMRVSANCMTPALWVHAGRPQMATDIQAHQVAGGFVPLTPLVRERLSEQELYDAVVGTAQSTLLLDQV